MISKVAARVPSMRCLDVIRVPPTVRPALVRQVALLSGLAASLWLSPVQGLNAQRLEDTLAYTTTTLNLRDQPFTSGRVLAILAPGTQVRTYTCSQGWCSVTVPVNRRSGYVAQEYLTLVPPAAQPQGRGYVNSRGVWVPSPQRTPDNQAPPGATAHCQDGTYSFSQSRRGTCSHHGGVAEWLSP
jgi:hypothetical protein